jgi:hypothetical protein
MPYFFWVIRLIYEMLTISAGIYKNPDRKTLYIDFETVSKKVPSIFYYLLVIGWFILFGRSFYFFRKLTGEFTDFLGKERTIGQSTFTIENVLVFFLILFLSGLVSEHLHACLTPPSSGQSKAGFACFRLPLMSNVSRRQVNGRGSPEE